MAQNHERFDVKSYTDANGVSRYHCLDGPAYRFNNITAWCQHSVLHRLDGPAKITDNKVSVVEEWRLYGAKIDPDEYKRWLQESNMDINNLTKQDRESIKLKYQTNFFSYSFDGD